MPSYEASIDNLIKAVHSPRFHRPRPWRSKAESEMIRRFAFWWYTSRDPISRPAGIGLVNSGLATRGFKSWSENLRKIQTR